MVDLLPVAIVRCYLFLASLACSDLIDLDFRGRVRSTSLKNVLGQVWVQLLLQ